MSERAVHSRRFRTLVREPAAEAKIEADLQLIASTVRASVGASLEALWLIGGYARGEGSIVEREGVLGPYNDYDLVAVVRGSARDRRGPLSELSHALTKQLGVDVDLWPLESDAVAHVPRTLFWLDVALGGLERIEGDASSEARLLRHRARDIPLDECGRLLANRAMGLALSNFEPVDRDLRKARHVHKAVLACGDSLLLAADHYRPTLAERLVELERLAHAPNIGRELVAAYRDAVQFRARPDLWQPPAIGLEAWYSMLRDQIGRAHLAFEATRVGTPTSALGYASYDSSIYPVLSDVARGTRALSSLKAALRRELPLFPWHGHVRERLARAVVLFAYAPDDGNARNRAADLIGVRRDADERTIHAKLELLARIGG